MNANTLLKKYTFLNDIQNEFSNNIDFSKTPISEVSEQSTQDGYVNKNKNKDLHEYIFQFYAYNEILSAYREKHNGIIDNEDLKIYSDYQDFINDFSKRIFSFILYSCSAEARHSNFISESEESGHSHNYLSELHIAYSKLAWKEKKNNKFYNHFLLHINTHFNEIQLAEFKENPDNFEQQFQTYLFTHYSMVNDLPADFIKKFNKTYVKEEPNIDKCLNLFSTKYSSEIKNIDRFAEFIKYLQEVNQVGRDGDNGGLQRALVREETIELSNISHFSTEEIFYYFSIFFLENFEYGYGGKLWSYVAEHALSFCRGEINAEVFIDRALSLEHNNGHIFDKNYLFSNFINTQNLYIFYARENSLHRISYGIKLTDFILSLQNSSSVLSMAHFLNVENTHYDDLIGKLNVNLLQTYHKDFSQYHLDYFYCNYQSIKNFSNSTESLSRMLALAKKLDYPIPKFDFANLCIAIADKIAQSNDSSTLLTHLQKNNSYNDIFNNIINGDFRKVKENSKELSPSKSSVFRLHNLTDHHTKDLSKELIGGKAKGLTELINKGFNVPKAMVFDTQTCLSYLSHPKYFQQQYKLIQQQISDYLTDENNNPLLVSVRSGAPVSMPGMMDSILNVGIDDNSYPLLCKIYTKEVINECSMSFMTQFCSSKLGLHIQFPKSLNKALDKFTEILIKNNISCHRRNLFPLSKEEQIRLSVVAVFDSWNSPRAIAWRNEKNISHNMGTAATIQQMVFGNKNNNSMTCVIFSRDCISGKNEIIGEYLVKAQGEDLVSGKKTPLPIKNLAQSHHKIYQEIEFIAKSLEEEKKAIQDLEITVEDGKVYLLQMRNAVVSPEAQISLAKELNLNLLDIIQPKHLIGESKVNTTVSPDFSGLSASPGLISGIIVKNKEDVEQYQSLGKPLIFFSNQALPEHAPIMIATQAFITEFGGVTSHAAILARSMEKPCIVGIGKQDLNAGDIFTIDATQGKIWKGELPIVVNQANAIDLSYQILEKEEVSLNEAPEVNQLIIQSWISNLSQSKILTQPKNNKNCMFLNIAQKTALALKMEQTKKNKLT